MKGFHAGTYRDHRDVFDFLLKLVVVVAIVVLIQLEQSRLSGPQAMATDMSLRLQSLSFETGKLHALAAAAGIVGDTGTFTF